MYYLDSFYKQRLNFRFQQLQPNKILNTYLNNAAVRWIQGPRRFWTGLIHDSTEICISNDISDSIFNGMGLLLGLLLGLIFSLSLKKSQNKKEGIVPQSIKCRCRFNNTYFELPPNQTLKCVWNKYSKSAASNQDCAL